MAKIALLIGVSEYGPDLNPLPGALKDVEVVKQVLQPSEMGGFDEVKQLLNPNPPVMREAIETLFSGRTKNDLVLLFFSGHVVQDDRSKLYFATSITSKSPKAEHIRVSTIPASFVHDLMSNSSCQCQVLILDCCLGRLSAQDMIANDDDSRDIKIQLGGEGRAILTSFTFTENSVKSEGSDSSVYTRYLVEGLRTGAADLDCDGWISADELHEYISNKVKVVAPAMKPAFYSVKDGPTTLLFKVPIDDPKLKYRKEAESWVRRGEISESARYILDQLAESLQLPFEDCSVIEAEVLKPYQEYQEKLQRYKHKFAKAISKNHPLSTQGREQLRGFQQSLGLRAEDVAPIEERITLKLVNLTKSEDNADALDQLERKSELNSMPSTPRIVLANSENLTPQPPSLTEKGELDSLVSFGEGQGEGLNPSSIDQQYLPSTVLPESVPIPPVQLTNSTVVPEDNANELAQSDSDREGKSVSLTPSTVLPESTPVPALAPTNLTPAVDLSSSLSGSQTSSPSVSIFPKKFLVVIGIGGALATLAVAIGVSTRTQVAPPANPANRVSSSPQSSVQPSPTAKISHEPSPSPSASPDSKKCAIFVNGNLRSEPVPFRENVVETLRESVAVTGKRTKEGWIQVRLSSGKLAWAHPEIISSDSEKEMETCLSRTGKVLEDVSTSPSSSSP